MWRGDLDPGGCSGKHPGGCETGISSQGPLCVDTETVQLLSITWVPTFITTVTITQLFPLCALGPASARGQGRAVTLLQAAQLREAPY